MPWFGSSVGWESGCEDTEDEDVDHIYFFLAKSDWAPFVCSECPPIDKTRIHEFYMVLGTQYRMF